MNTVARVMLEITREKDSYQVTFEIAFLHENRMTNIKSSGDIIKYKERRKRSIGVQSFSF